MMVISTANTYVVEHQGNGQADCDLCQLDNRNQKPHANYFSNGCEFPAKYDIYVSETLSLYSGANGQQQVRLNVTRA